MGLIEAFIHKVIFPTIDADWAIFENESISLLPDLPGCNNEDFHEEAAIEVMFGNLLIFDFFFEQETQRGRPPL